MADAQTHLINPPRARSAGTPRTLRELRVAKGWKLRDLAQASGLHVATVSQIERGRLAPTPIELAALSDAVGLELAAALMVVHWEPA